LGIIGAGRRFCISVVSRLHRDCSKFGVLLEVTDGL